MIADDNLLIAVFMGAELHDNNCIKWPHSCRVVPGAEYLRYHESWDVLMPVIKEIGSLGDGHTLSDGRLFPIVYNLIGVRIGMAHNQIVEFIKWYNTSG